MDSTDRAENNRRTASGMAGAPRPYLQRLVVGDGAAGCGMSSSPDVETASDAYARRFDGPVGRFFLETQKACIRRLLGPDGGAGLHVLEVGGGHGQLTRLLLEAGCTVTVQGSAAKCRRRIEPLMDEFPGRLKFVESSLWRLPFPDYAFDLVIGIRLLAHVERWRDLLGEMARVSRRQVVIGYSPITGVNLLAPLFYRAKLIIEGNTRPYACYATALLIACMAEFGFHDFAVERQFVIPMAVHRGLNAERLSQAAEGACRRMGLTRLFGAPALLSVKRAV